MGNDLNSLKAVIIALQNKVKELRELCTAGGTGIDNSQLFEEVICEINERNKRSCNLLMFGIAEQPSNRSRDGRLTAENDVAVDILTQVVPEFPAATNLNENHLQIRRLGRFDPQRPRPRPIKITFREEKHVHEFVKNAKKLKSTEAYKNITLAFDKTPKQIDYYKKLKAQLEERQNNGEQNLMIRYVNGVPRISKKTLN